jgi:hypothetical protein
MGGFAMTPVMLIATGAGRLLRVMGAEAAF